MARSTNWEDRLGRRLRLRDLHVLFAVAHSGSMAKAAVHMGVSQPAVSKAVGDLETALGVRLFDRGPHGVQPTMYGSALMRCGSAVFDELRQGIREIEFLADPSGGEIRVGCPESLASVVSTIIGRLLKQHPRLVVHVAPTSPALMELDGLRDRDVDLLLGRVPQPLVESDIDVETLYEDQLLVIAGAQNRWAQRRKVALSDLTAERWVHIPQGNLLSSLVAEAFRARKLTVPRESVTTVSIHVRNHLLATGEFLTILPSSAMTESADRWRLKALPIDLGVRLPPVGILTLKHRTLSPVVRLFIDHARALARSMPTPRRARRSS